MASMSSSTPATGHRTLKNPKRNVNKIIYAISLQNRLLILLGAVALSMLGYLTMPGQ